MEREDEGERAATRGRSVAELCAGEFGTDGARPDLLGLSWSVRFVGEGLGPGCCSRLVGDLRRSPSLDELLDGLWCSAFSRGSSSPEGPPPSSKSSLSESRWRLMEDGERESDL